MCKDKPTTTPTVDSKACPEGTFSSTGKDDAAGGCQACESGTSFTSSEASTSCVSCQNCVSTETQCSATADAKCYSKCAARVEYSVLGATGDTSEASTYGPCKRCSKCMVEDATGTTVEDASLVNKQCGVAQDTTCNKVSKIKVVITMAGVTVATFTEAAKNTYENTFRVKNGLEDREKNLVKLTVEDVTASRRRRALGTVHRGRRSLLADGVKITTDLTIKHQAAAGAPAGATPEEVAQQMEAKVAKIAQDIDKGMADGSFAEDLKKAAVEAQIEVLAADTVQVAAVTKAVDNIQKVVETKVIVEAPKPTVPVNPGGASNQVKADKPDDTASEGGGSIGPIAGGAVGFLVITVIIGVALWNHRRQNAARQKAAAAASADEGVGHVSISNPMIAVNQQKAAAKAKAAAAVAAAAADKDNQGITDAQLEGKYATATALVTGRGTLFLCCTVVERS